MAINTANPKYLLLHNFLIKRISQSKLTGKLHSQITLMQDLPEIHLSDISLHGLIDK